MNLKGIIIIGTPPLDNEQIDSLQCNGVKIYDNSNEILSPEKIINTVGNAHTVALGASTHITKEVALNCKNLRKIISYTSGIDHIDIESCKQRNITINNIKGYCATTIAEKIIGFIIMSLNKFIPAMNDVKSGNWKGENFQGRELKKKNVCIIGTGTIGNKLFQLIKEFDVNITQVNTKTSLKQIEVFLSKADVISLNIPLTERSRSIINKETLSLLKSNVVLVNTSRGGLIDEDALYLFLKTNKGATAVLDVLSEEPPPSDHPLLSLDNAFITPHICWNSLEAAENMKQWLYNEITSGC